MKTIEKTLEVKATFKMRGDLPKMVTNAHIKHNITNEIAKYIGEVVLHGEYYGDYDEEWTIFLCGEPSVVIKQTMIR